MSQRHRTKLPSGVVVTNNYFIQEQHAVRQVPGLRKMIIERLAAIGWKLVAVVDESLVFGKEDQMGAPRNGDGSEPVACRIERDGPIVYVYDECSELVDAYVDHDRLPIRIRGFKITSYCTKPDAHVDVGHDVTCVPPSDPDNPALRLLRAVYGLCPDCDRGPGGTHDHVQ